MGQRSWSCWRHWGEARRGEGDGDGERRPPATGPGESVHRDQDRTGAGAHGEHVSSKSWAPCPTSRWRAPGRPLSGPGTTHDSRALWARLRAHTNNECTSPLVSSRYTVRNTGTLTPSYLRICAVRVESLDYLNWDVKCSSEPDLRNARQCTTQNSMKSNQIRAPKRVIRFEAPPKKERQVRSSSAQ